MAAEITLNASKEPDAPKRARRGFAAMSPELVREISSRGGRAAHQAGVAHKFTPEEAKEAGRKGASALRNKRRAARAKVPE